MSICLCHSLPEMTPQWLTVAVDQQDPPPYFPHPLSQGRHHYHLLVEKDLINQHIIFIYTYINTNKDDKRVLTNIEYQCI